MCQRKEIQHRRFAALRHPTREFHDNKLSRAITAEGSAVTPLVWLDCFAAEVIELDDLGHLLHSEAVNRFFLQYRTFLDRHAASP
jgi:hypothetical protein